MQLLRDRLLLLRVLREARPPLVAAITAVLAAQALIPAALAVAMAELVGVLGHGQAAPGTFGRAVLPLAAFTGLLLTGHLGDAVIGPLQYRAKWRIDGAHRIMITSLATADPGIAVLERPDVQDLVRIAAADPANWTERTPGDGALAQLALLTRYLGLASSCAVLAAYSPWLIPALAVPALGVRAIQRRRVLQVSRKWVSGISEGRRCEHWREMVTTPVGGKELRVFGFGQWSVDRMQHHVRSMFGPVWELGGPDRWRQGAVFLLTVIPLSVVYGLVAAGTVDAHRSVAVEAAVLAVGWTVYMAIIMAGDAFAIEGALPCIRSAAELRIALGAAEETPAPEPASWNDGRPPAVRFEDVSFTYPGSPAAVLARLSLEIHPGEMLAIVGLNGAGKSTLIKLLAGLYEPTEGQVTAGGVDIRQNLTAWRRKISVVFQDFIRYQLPAEDNVALGRIGLERDRGVVEAAAREAGFSEVLQRLPAGWDTPLARSRTGGVDLSGGQWQQVALSRALYAVLTGARLLVLDEPTAHLDVRTEAELFGRLSGRARETTVVLISHRLSTVRQADRIVLLDGGRITESGSHAELMALGGAYAVMFALQAERFTQGYSDRLEEGEPA